MFTDKQRIEKINKCFFILFYFSSLSGEMQEKMGLNASFIPSKLSEKALGNSKGTPSLITAICKA
jgi:hypothetical protein